MEDPRLTTFAATPVIAVVFVLSLIQLTLYFRLRRRGLIERDRMARLLAGSLLGQALAYGFAPAVALLLTAPALVALWRMSRRVLPMAIHRRAWSGLVLVLVVVQAARMLIPGLGAS